MVAVIVFLLIGLTYFFLCWRPCKRTIAKYDVSPLTQQFEIEQKKAAQGRRMQQEIDENRKSKIGRVYPYNSLKGQVQALNSIMGESDSFDISFDRPIRENDSVRRDVIISFTTGSMDGAEKIVEKLYRCPYRCLIRDVSLEETESGCIADLTVTFIETMRNATTSEGLVDGEKDKGGDSQNMVEEYTSD